jgi:hypothetical protein
MCHASLSLSIKTSVTSKNIRPVIILSRLHTSVIALPISQQEENYWCKNWMLLIEILQKLHYVPRFESFMAADFRRMAFWDECRVVFWRWRQHVPSKHSCLSANYTLSQPSRQQSLHYVLFKYKGCTFFNACSVHFLLFLLHSTNAQSVLYSHKYTACTRDSNVEQIFVSLING